MRQVLKYPGSKWNIAEKLTALIPEHHSYVEPYFGSGALFFSKAPSAIETINDLDSDVVNLFRCIRKDSERFARLVMTIPFSREEYDSQFDIPETLHTDSFERAAGFLIRCWQGHGFRTSGNKVGWKNDVQGRERMYIQGNGFFVNLVLHGVASSFRVSLGGGGQIRTRSPLRSSALIPTKYHSCFMFISIRVGFHLPRVNTSKQSPQCSPP